MARKLHCNLIIFLQFVLFAFFSKPVSAKLQVIEGSNLKYLSSSGFEYPDNEPLDVIWLFEHSIRLIPKEFHLNGHAGNFILVSEQPLLDLDYFKSINGSSEEGYLNRLAKSILTDQGLLLSWKVNKTIEAINNEEGTFVLFHSEPKDPSGNPQFDFGFEIEVENYDHSITTTPPTTQAPRVPDPDETTYITKYLSCKPPLEFFEEQENFTQRIADLASKYCREYEIPGCSEEDIRKDEVNIPGANQGSYAGLHYCDETWSIYETCVEVTFAILRADDEGNFVLPREQLERMWEEMSHELAEFGYCPYDPPRAKIDLNTVVWVAFFLGIIISLTALLAVAWMRNTKALLEYRKSFMDDPVGGIDNIKDTVDDKHQLTTYDPNNPLYAAINRQLYPSEPGDFLNVEDIVSSGPFKKRSTENPTFHEIEADVCYDNSGFVEEQNDSLQAGRSTNNDTDDVTLFMRSSWGQRGSATEI